MVLWGYLTYRPPLTTPLRDLVGGVTIKLTGSTLTAKAAYTMRK